MGTITGGTHGIPKEKKLTAKVSSVEQMLLDIVGKVQELDLYESHERVASNIAKTMGMLADLMVEFGHRPVLNEEIPPPKYTFEIIGRYWRDKEDK